MKLFWKINLWISIITFLLFLLYFIVVKFSFSGSTVGDFIMSFTFLFFIYGAFLEIIQIPLCLIALIFNHKQKNIGFFFLMMVIFFIIKIGLYVYTLGTGL
jgi:hypothetical protein